MDLEALFGWVEDDEPDLPALTRLQAALVAQLDAQGWENDGTHLTVSLTDQEYELLCKLGVADEDIEA